ncbi:hypothetical protein L1049_005136 [Liquidambar formosana]|uniref:Uncharacterized protein n=1 Tax=Liquidambar formosana TaxID=63359 RepID=A0AAP0RPD6_LIQFO
MASDHPTFHNDLTHNHFTTTTTTATTTIRRPFGLKIHLRRRKLPYVRLGGKKPRQGRLFLVRILKKIRLRWVKHKYLCMLKKLKQYYRNMIKDLIEASASVESFQQRILMEASYAVPTMGVSFSC